MRNLDRNADKEDWEIEFDNDSEVDKKDAKRVRVKSILVKSDQQPTSVIETKLSDFDRVTVIGRGAYGKVFLVRYRKTGEPFAMKVMKKHEMIEKSKLDDLILEKNIQMQAKHPFLMEMHWVFQSDTRIYFIMRFVRGGDLFNQMDE